MRKERKHYTAEEKVAILRRHLLEQEPISKFLLQVLDAFLLRCLVGAPRQVKRKRALQGCNHAEG